MDNLSLKKINYTTDNTVYVDIFLSLLVQTIVCYFLMKHRLSNGGGVFQRKIPGETGSMNLDSFDDSKLDV